MRYFLALAYLYQNKKEDCIEQLNNLIPKECPAKNLAKHFADFDMYNEIKSIDWFDSQQIFDSVPKLVKEKLLVQNHKYIMDIRKLNLQVKIDFNLYFDIKCVNYLVLKAIIKYENNELDYAKNILRKAERLDKDNIGVVCYLALIYLRQDVEKSEPYIQRIFDLNRKRFTVKRYLELYRNKLTKHILSNPEANKKLSNKTQILINVTYGSFDKAKKLFNEILENDKDYLAHRAIYLDIYLYLIENLHRNKYDTELINLVNTIKAKFNIDFENFDESNAENYLKKEKPIITKTNLYTGISYFNLKEFEKAKFFLSKKYAAKQESLMAEFYFNVIKLKEKKKIYKRY